MGLTPRFGLAVRTGCDPRIGAAGLRLLVRSEPERQPLGKGKSYRGQEHLSCHAEELLSAGSRALMVLNLGWEVRCEEQEQAVNVGRRIWQNRQM